MYGDVKMFVESEFKILCNTHQACPEVKKILKDLGFANLKDLDNSPSYDISAKVNVEHMEHAREIAQHIFEECNEKVQGIQITIKA